MNRQELKIAKRVRRHKRVRARMSGDAKRPRLVVFRANQHIYAQIIDDASQKTIVASSSLELKTKGKKADQSAEVGTSIAKKALAKDISEVVFDRGGFKYHGRVKALADAARAAGLKF
ncbi:MAG: 50S ribosomal protein L18 [Candidatus Doudnabacteria bacterium Gr01-1014_77]|uniref:Large ribosomal subunit protein uL18 n=1 Tax=Candidatus Doudnabacteria bacterium Gr01-1014_77 TaxID=2017133 RepID=A0A554J958_9BACT|nr:MAG: 50S ribosomal protein L18 [Candidatus Doudnabacteria bacterium Gr01-1014_77]